ncbi:uncharacterized protein LOC126742356 isoform X2 [Anthonomus grandis grandis]|uniref:uncharacterized protein LOC126742356 isoform X2 n=1 Tax=Anthonomus grandis grandis TaxID=2921223 RepID=UPI00216607A2|nr:uncharacterized protein LOC126742356 isoform X2 [Anthonomus grandis grandis]
MSQSKISALLKLLSVFDVLFSALIVAPCVIIFWRGIWDLMAVYIYPEDLILSTIVSTIFGICGRMLSALCQTQLEDSFHPKMGKISWYLASRVYTIVMGVVVINSWRGPWELLTLLTGEDNLMVHAVSFFGGLMLLMMAKSVRNTNSTPCEIVTDSDVDNYFKIVTRFKTYVSGRVSFFILDCIFSVVIVGTLVVFIWRGLWIMVDIFLFPDDPEASAHGSLILGYSIIAVLFIMQPIVRNVCNKLSGAARLLFADLFIIVCLVGTINVWRGIWMCLDIYFLPDNKVLSCWITLTVSLVLLILLGCSNSLLVRGVYIDAEEPDGKCVVLPCYYLRIIFQAEKLKKINKKMQMYEKPEKLDNIENNHIVTISGIVDEDDCGGIDNRANSDILKGLDVP